MTEVPVHFMGFLLNVDDSITGLQLDDGFRIERKSQAEVMPFLDSIEKSYGDQEGVQLIAFDSQGSPKGCYCVTKPSVDQFEATSRGGMVIKWATAETVHSQLQDKLRLLRLFKEGNVVMPYSCLYRNSSGGHVDIPSLVRSYPVWDRTPFALERGELEEVRSFIATHSLPLPKEYLQLAFESFELSYEVHNGGLAFLSLMIAMEVLLGPKDGRKVTHSISGNAAKLLASSAEEGTKIFGDMKKLYCRRSELVHTGYRSLVSREDMLKLRQYVREAIKEAMKSGMLKDALLSTLKTCGFGERPWRVKP